MGSKRTENICHRDPNQKRDGDRDMDAEVEDHPRAPGRFQRTVMPRNQEKGHIQGPWGFTFL